MMNVKELVQHCDLIHRLGMGMRMCFYVYSHTS
jgi:hypothetical protein